MYRKLIEEIEALDVDTHRESFPKLREIAARALEVIPAGKFLPEKRAMQDVIWVIDNISGTQGENFETWLHWNFKYKRNSAIEILRICQLKEKSPFDYSY